MTKLKRYTLLQDGADVIVFDKNIDVVHFPTDTEFVTATEADKVMDAYEARINELESENNTLKADIEVLNDDCRIAKENEVKYHKAYMNELDENAELKKQVPKWHIIADGDLPEGYREFDRFLVYCEFEVEGKMKGYSTECYLTCGCKPYRFFDVSDNRFASNAVKWCELPAPTEESSATEKENG